MEIVLTDGKKLSLDRWERVCELAHSFIADGKYLDQKLELWSRNDGQLLVHVVLMDRDTVIADAAEIVPAGTGLRPALLKLVGNQAMAVDMADRCIEELHRE